MCGPNSGGTRNSVGVGAVKPGEIMAKKRKSAADELTKRTQDPTIVPEVVELEELTPEEQKEGSDAKKWHRPQPANAEKDKG